MKFSKNHIVKTIKDTGMIPVFYHSDADLTKHVIDTCYQEGIKVFEFTNRGASAEVVFKSLIRHVEQYPDFILGIGTILDDATTKKYIDLGAHFIVSPILKPSMAAICREHDILWIPGCATLTEIVNGKESGAEIIKVFPASVLGPQFVSAIMPVVPGLQLMPTGGVEPTEKDLSAWFRAGVVCVGLGSQLISKQILFEKDWAKLRSDIARVTEIIGTLKNKDKSLNFINL